MRRFRLDFYWRGSIAWFVVLLPAEPEQAAGRFEEQATHTFEAADGRRGLAFGVSYLDAPAGWSEKAPTTKSRLEVLRGAMLKNHRLFKERELTVSQHPALDLTLRKPS